jgi:hypothetical protein
MRTFLKISACFVLLIASTSLYAQPKLRFGHINSQELLAAMARGQAFSLRTKKGFQVCVVIAVPPFLRGPRHLPQAVRGRRGDLQAADE